MFVIDAYSRFIVGWPPPWQPILALDALEQALWARFHRESGRFTPTKRVRKTGESGGTPHSPIKPGPFRQRFIFSFDRAVGGDMVYACLMKSSVVRCDRLVVWWVGVV